MRAGTLRTIETARQLLRELSEGRTANVPKSTLEYAEAIVDLVGDAPHAHHGLTPTDLRAMAQACIRQAEDLERRQLADQDQDQVTEQEP